MKKNHLEIILEDMRGKFDLVLEGQDVLNQKIEGVRQELNEKFEYNTFLIQGLNNKIDNVKESLKKIDDGNESLSKKIDEGDARLSKKIDEVDTRLSKKIDGVEVRLGIKIDAVADDLAAHRADTESHSQGPYRVLEK